MTISFNYQGGSLERLKEELGKTIPPDERKILDEGGSHPGDCLCDICRQYWKLLGPDEDGNFGPFGKELS